MECSLLPRRDATAFNDVRHPKSGMDRYTPATMLEKQRQKGVDTSQIASIPFFDNLFPAGMASIFNNAFGLDPVCSASDPNPGFNPAWSNTQFFYAMQTPGGGKVPTRPCPLVPRRGGAGPRPRAEPVAHRHLVT